MQITPRVVAQARPLLNFIAQPESGGDYNIVWGGIKSKHRPRQLTSMTIGEVLAWQDSIDPLYMSEAAGKYQILEDTLRGLYRDAGMSVTDMFDEGGQDRLATTLLFRRGYQDYLQGKLSLEKFCNSLAKEWASLPVVTDVRRGTRVVRKGQSYYAGDSLNKAHVSVGDFMDAVRKAKQAPAPEPAQEVPSQGIWAALVSFFLSIFGK
ncbi:hypothetical protein ROJ8625_04086 [Roseivivax jejudonensis]|uniref:Uncharacterized protein n=1 Tax=Roseivivax jejudonensis TaxID=1529041 RepID=A0A1X7ABB5_9RHOB|nr:hypothetical protein [Roseivivax jejudonensis]SLN74721.1 hypothetical protein ROJ8625_04086 [Roseivivax jejudonensis]